MRECSLSNLFRRAKNTMSKDGGWERVLCGREESGCAISIPSHRSPSPSPCPHRVRASATPHSIPAHHNHHLSNIFYLARVDPSCLFLVKVHLVSTVHTLHTLHTLLTLHALHTLHAPHLVLIFFTSFRQHSPTKKENEIKSAKPLFLFSLSPIFFFYNHIRP